MAAFSGYVLSRNDMAAVEAAAMRAAHAVDSLIDDAHIGTEDEILALIRLEEKDRRARFFLGGLGRKTEARTLWREHIEEALENVRSSPFGSKAREHLCDTAYLLAQLELELNSVGKCISSWRIGEELFQTLSVRGKCVCQLKRCRLGVELKKRIGVHPSPSGPRVRVSNAASAVRNAGESAHLDENTKPELEHMLDSPPTPFFVGDTVLLEGLRQRPALNGRIGVVREEIGPDADRYVVDVAPPIDATVGQTAPLDMVKVLPRNVFPADVLLAVTFQRGDVVEVLSSCQYQGERGVVAPAWRTRNAAGRILVLFFPDSSSTGTAADAVSFDRTDLKKIHNQTEHAAQQVQLDRDAERILNCGSLFVGDTVLLEGLQKNSELNNRIGVVRKEIGPDADRYVVDVAPPIDAEDTVGEVTAPAPLTVKVLPRNVCRCPPADVPEDKEAEENGSRVQGESASPRFISGAVADHSECAICLGELEEDNHAVATCCLARCGHTFHGECMARSALSNVNAHAEERCPFCRQTITETDRRELSIFITKIQRSETKTPAGVYLERFYAQDVVGAEIQKHWDAVCDISPAEQDYNLLRVRQRNVLRAAHEARGTLYCISAHERRQRMSADRLDTVGVDLNGYDDPVIQRACDVALNKQDIYGDGDQSPLGGGPGGVGWALQQHWARGGTLDVLGPGVFEHSAIFRAAAWGNHKELLKLFCEGYDDAVLEGAPSSRRINNLGRSEKTRAIERRHSSLRFSCLHVCVYGNKLMEEKGIKRSVKKIRSLVESRTSGSTTFRRQDVDHVRCAELLLQHGARADARDVLGHSVLAHALGLRATDATRRIAGLLLAAGSDPLRLDRIGGCLLYDAALDVEENSSWALRLSVRTLNSPETTLGALKRRIDIGQGVLERRFLEDEMIPELRRRMLCQEAGFAEPEQMRGLPSEGGENRN